VTDSTEPAADGTQGVDAARQVVEARRQRTLRDLAAYAAIRRSDLVAAAWRAGNRDVPQLAEAARVNRSTIYVDLAAHDIDPREERKMPEAVEIPPPGWRHPNLTRVVRVPAPLGQVRYEYTFARPFTRRDPDPATVESQSDRGGVRTMDDVYQADRERREVRHRWALDVLPALVRSLLDGGSVPEIGVHAVWSDDQKPASRWVAYAATRDALTAAYRELDATPDTMWRAALLRVHDAKQPAVDAAHAWDQAGVKFAKLAGWLRGKLDSERYPVEWKEVEKAAEACGVDISGWAIGDVDDYERSGWDGRPASPAVREISEIISKGDARIRAVAELAGEAR